MTGIGKLETLVSGWLKPMPHLPKNAQKWIAENSWWLVLIGVILSGFGLLIGLMGLFAAMAFVGTSVGYYGYGANAYGGALIVSTIVSLVFSVGLVILLGIAISPLKAMKAKGWDMLFWVLLLDVVYVVVNALVSLGSLNIISFVFSLIFGAISSAISAYFLFEIKSHFVKA
jgi:hypothetical protein